MSRLPFVLSLLLAFAAAPLRADDDSSASVGPAATVSADNGADAKKDPILVNPDAVKAQTEELHDAVANPSIDNYSVSNQAADFFEGLQRQTPLVRPAPRVMDREDVDGHVGTIDGMIDAAQSRYDHWKFTTTEVPPPELDSSVATAKAMRENKRADFDKTGRMAENQMGEFKYASGSNDPGRIDVNQMMALIATRIGEAFACATLVHEAAHAWTHALGRLSPSDVVAGEVIAYRVEGRYLHVIDPRAERMIVMISTFGLYLQQHPEDQVTRASLGYLNHLLTIWDTNGDEQKLRKMVEDLGYRDGDKTNPGGVNPEAKGLRV